MVKKPRTIILIMLAHFCMHAMEGRDSFLKKKGDLKKSINEERRKSRIGTQELKEAAIEHFTKIEAGGMLQIDLKFDENPRIECENKNLELSLKKVENGTLYLLCPQNRPHDAPFLKVSVFAKMIESLSVCNNAQIISDLPKKISSLEIEAEGKGRIELIAAHKLDNLEIAVLGADIEYVGDVNDLTVVCSADGTLKLDADKIKNAKISMQDNSQCRIRKSEKNRTKINTLIATLKDKALLTVQAEVQKLGGSRFNNGKLVISGKVKNNEFTSTGNGELTYQGTNSDRSSESSFGNYNEK